MNLQDIIQKLNSVSRNRYVEFVMESDSKCCKKCLQYNGMIFKEDDLAKPELPLHPNCRCKYVPVSVSKISSIKSRIVEVQGEVSQYSRLLTQKASDLVNEAESFLPGTTANGSRADFLLKSAKVSVLIVLIQSAIFNIEKIELTAKKLQQIFDDFTLVFPNDAGEMQALADDWKQLVPLLRKMHYSRLMDKDQQLENLPRSPEEALKRGFTLAPDSQSRYHRNNEEEGNQKYYHKITGQEVVFNEKGKIVTSPENIGTKNYGPDPISLEHVLWDILPYWIWGNSEEDMTPLSRRIFGN